MARRFQPKKRNGAPEGPPLEAPKEAQPPVAAPRSTPGVDASTVPLVTGDAHAGVFGVTRSGKTTWLLSQLAKRPRVVVVDIDGEYSRFRSSGRGLLAEEMRASELSQYPTKLREPHLSLAVIPDDDTPRAGARAFALVAELARNYQMPLTLVAEEVGDWGQMAEGELRTLVTRGAKRGVQLIVVAQRPALVPKTVRSQLSQLVMFRTVEPGDLEALEERTHSPDVFSLRELPTGRCLVWSALTPSATAPTVS